MTDQQDGADVWGVRRDRRGSEDRGRWLKLVGFLALTLFLMYVWIALNSRISVRPVDASPMASALVLRDTAGKTIRLDDLRGNLTVVNLWAAWCGPCRAEIPALERVQRELADRGVQVLGVNVEARAIEELAAESDPLAIRYSVWFAPDGFTETFNRSNRIPQTFLIDAEGRVRAEISGRVSARALLTACREVLDG